MNEESLSVELVTAHYMHDEPAFSRAFSILIETSERLNKPLAAKLRLIQSQVSKGPIKVPVKDLPKDIEGAVYASEGNIALNQMQLDDVTRKALKRIVSSYQHRNKLSLYGLDAPHKVLFHGPPGVGKTMASNMLSYELKIPLYTVNLNAVTDSLLGETGKRLKKLFEFIHTTMGVFLIDEFDALGSSRAGSGNDVGEVKRILTTLLLCMDQSQPRGVLIAATNMYDALDPALYRRFDEEVRFFEPSYKAKVSKIVEMISVLPSSLGGDMDVDHIAKVECNGNLRSNIEAIKSLAMIEVCMKKVMAFAVINDTKITGAMLEKAFAI